MKGTERVVGGGGRDLKTAVFYEDYAHISSKGSMVLSRIFVPRPYSYSIPIF